MYGNPWSLGMRTHEAIAKIERDSSQETADFASPACPQSSGKRVSSQRRASKSGRKSGSKAHKKGRA